MPLGGALISAAAKARRQFAMPCEFGRIALMGDRSDRRSKAVQCLRNLASIREYRSMVRNALLQRRRQLLPVAIVWSRVGWP
jgi:hypothetical protein